MDKSKQTSKARERRLRAKYRRNIRIAVILCLVIGLAIGFVVGRMTTSTLSLPGMDPRSTPTVLPTSTPAVTVIPTATVVPTTAPAAIVTVIPTAEPTEAVTVEPTVEPTAEATANTTAEATAPVAALSATEPAAESDALTTVQSTTIEVPFGETVHIPVQVYSDGSLRNDTQPLPYEELNFLMTVHRLLDNDYYVSNYGSTHRLEDGTAGIEFELMLNDYQGSTVIDPNKLVKNMRIEAADGTFTYGYRLTNAEISGSDSFTMQTNVPMMLYKRFVQGKDAPMYLVVTTKVDGVDQVYKFELNGSVETTAEPTASAESTEAADSTESTETTETPVEYTSMRVGDRSDAVKELQELLIDKGYLEEGSADGIFGNGTAEAVKKAQTDLGLTVDGIAGPQFQSAFFAD